MKTGEARRFQNFQRAVLTPDGSEILHKDRSKNPRSMYVYRIADGSVRALPGVFIGHERGASFGLSPDGQWIANHSESEIRLHSHHRRGWGGVVDDQRRPAIREVDRMDARR